MKRVSLLGFLLVATACSAAPQITSLSLIGDGQNVRFNNGSTLKFGVPYTVRAQANNRTQSVRFKIDSNTPKTINQVPYDCPIKPQSGNHRIVITPYLKDNGQGKAGPFWTVQFSVVQTTPTPSPTLTPSPSPTPTTPTPTPSPSPTPSATATPTPATPTPTASPTPSPTGTATPSTPSPSPTPSPTPSASPIPSPTPPPSPTPTPSPNPTPSITPSPSPSTVSVIASWQATQGDSYKVYYGTASGQYKPPIDAGTSDTWMIGGLLPNTDYYFALTSVRDGIESPKSPETPYRTSTVSIQRLKLGPH